MEGDGIERIAWKLPGEACWSSPLASTLRALQRPCFLEVLKTRERAMGPVSVGLGQEGLKRKAHLIKWDQGAMDACLLPVFQILPPLDNP